MKSICVGVGLILGTVGLAFAILLGLAPSPDRTLDSIVYVSTTALLIMALLSYLSATRSSPIVSPASPSWIKITTYIELAISLYGLLGLVAHHGT